MGLATSVKTEWGYYVTGDTDPTTIWEDGRRYIKGVAWEPAAADDTFYISTTRNVTGGDTQVISSTSAGTAGVTQYWHWGDIGIPMDNIKIALSNGSAKLYIYVRS